MAALPGSASQVQVDALGTAPVGPLYAKMSLPIVLSMLVNGSYNLVDAAFVTRGIGPVAMGGVALAFPLHMLLYSCGALIGNGAASIVSRMLGASHAHAANAAALGAIVLGFMVSVLLAVAGLAFLEPVLLAFGATEALLPHSR